MKFKHIKIDGMTCGNCEKRIESRLKSIEGVKSSKASYVKSSVEIEFDDKILSLENITNSIRELSYHVIKVLDISKSDKNTRSSNKRDFITTISIVLFLITIYILIKNTIGFNFIPKVDKSMSYGILFIVGALTSIHCISMCGGINISQSISNKNMDAENLFMRIKPAILYNLGRVISYTIIGGIIGAIGSVIGFSNTTKGIIAIFAAVFMLIMGLNLLNIIPFFRKFNLKIPEFKKLNKLKTINKNKAFIVGILNGFMPCGPLQTIQLYAMGTGSFILGAFSMFMFSIGTVPLMFGFGALSSLLNSNFTKRMMKVSGILVIVLGVIMFSRGLNLAGIKLDFFSNAKSSISSIHDDIQLVSTKLESGKYTPITVQKGILVKWTITATEKDLNGCNNPITIPKYNITTELVPGENLIEFTPIEEGVIIYTCWMGMINSNINVVLDINQIK